MKRTLTPINNYSDMVYVIESAGAWFIGSFMVEILDEFETFQNKSTKKKRIEQFYKDYDCNCEKVELVRDKINIAIRIIESNLVYDAMEYVLNTNDAKIGCDYSKVNAQFLLDRLASGESVLPTFNE